MNEKGLLRLHDQYILFLFFVSFQWLFLRFLTISFRLFIHFISFQRRKKEKCVDFVYEFGKEIYIKKRKKKFVEYFSSYDRRAWKGLSLLFVTIFNLLFVLFLIYSVRSLNQNEINEQINEQIYRKKSFK